MKRMAVRIITIMMIMIFMTGITIQNVLANTNDDQNQKFGLVSGLNFNDDETLRSVEIYCYINWKGNEAENTRYVLTHKEEVYQAILDESFRYTKFENGKIKYVPDEELDNYKQRQYSLEDVVDKIPVEIRYINRKGCIDVDYMVLYKGKLLPADSFTQDGMIITAKANIQDLKKQLEEKRKATENKIDEAISQYLSPIVLENSWAYVLRYVDSNNYDGEYPDISYIQTIITDDKINNGCSYFTYGESLIDTIYWVYAPIIAQKLPDVYNDNFYKIKDFYTYIQRMEKILGIKFYTTGTPRYCYKGKNVKGKGYRIAAYVYPDAITADGQNIKKDKWMEIKKLFYSNLIDAKTKKLLKDKEVEALMKQDMLKNLVACAFVEMKIGIEGRCMKYLYKMTNGKLNRNVFMQLKKEFYTNQLEEPTTTLIAKNIESIGEYNKKFYEKAQALLTQVQHKLDKFPHPSTVIPVVMPGFTPDDLGRLRGPIYVFAGKTYTLDPLDNKSFQFVSKLGNTTNKKTTAVKSNKTTVSKKVVSKKVTTKKTASKPTAKKVVVASR